MMVMMIVILVVMLMKNLSASSMGKHANLNTLLPRTALVPTWKQGHGP